MNKIIITGLILLFLSPIIAYIIFFDCLQDHTTPLIELGDPLQKNIIAFQKKNKVFTEFDQIENILLKSGCSNIKVIKYKPGKDRNGVVFVKRLTYSCIYKKKELTVIAKMDLEESSFILDRLELTMGYGRCYIYLDKDRILDPTKLTRRCSQDTCILSNMNYH